MDKLPTIKITEQTCQDMGMWLTQPTLHTPQQLARLADEEARLPLIKLINEYWLAGAFYHSLKNAGVLKTLDDDFQLYLTELEKIYAQRAHSIKQEAVMACQILQQHQIPVLLLKGSASLFAGVFKPDSCRFMSDVDILVPEQQQGSAQDILLSEGYIQDLPEYAASMEHHHHGAPLIRGENGACKLELHKHVLKHSASNILDNRTAWQQAIPLYIAKDANDTKDAKDIKICQLMPTHQVMLSIAHSEISHSGYRECLIDWRQLYNLFCLSKHHQDEINWSHITEKFVNANQLPALEAHLYNAHIYFGLPLPIAINKHRATKHLKKCITKLVRQQAARSRWSAFNDVLDGYRKENIVMMYGNQGRFSITLSRVKKLIGHINMVFDKQARSRFIRKLKQP